MQWRKIGFITTSTYLSVFLSIHHHSLVSTLFGRLFRSGLGQKSQTLWSLKFKINLPLKFHSLEMFWKVSRSIVQKRPCIDPSTIHCPSTQHPFTQFPSLQLCLKGIQWNIHVAYTKHNFKYLAWPTLIWALEIRFPEEDSSNCKRNPYFARDVKTTGWRARATFSSVT